MGICGVCVGGSIGFEMGVDGCSSGGLAVVAVGSDGGGCCGLMVELVAGQSQMKIANQNTEINNGGNPYAFEIKRKPQK